MNLESIQKAIAAHIAKAHPKSALSLLEEWTTAYGSKNAQIAQTMIRSDWEKLKNEELCGVARDATMRHSEIRLRILQFQWDVKTDDGGRGDDFKSPNLNILFMGANPFSTAKVPLHEICYEIQRRLNAKKSVKPFTLNEYLFTRKTDFQNKILEEKPNMIHFAGLGKLTKAQTEKLCKKTNVANWEAFGGLVFHDREFHSIESVNAEDLGALFQYFVETEKIPIHTVILSAGHASLQARAIAQYVPYVIGMRHELNQALAIEFSDAFYSALAAGQSVPDAFERSKVFIGASIVKESIRFYMNNKLQA